MTTITAARIASAGLDWLLPTWPAATNVHGLVTTRQGGVSGGSTASMDLGPANLESLDDASRIAVLANRARVAALLPSAPVWLEQVHGIKVIVIDDRNVGSARTRPPIADSVVTRLADVPLAIRVADCLPVLIADNAGTSVAAAHAGWRGLAAGVLEATIQRMQASPASLVAWLGPAIGPRAFEVGDDVREAFCRDDVDARASFVQRSPGKWMADLPALARRRLAAAGVRQVTGGEHCTLSDASRFFSYRRDRTTARMGAFVWRSAQ